MKVITENLKVGTVKWFNEKRGYGFIISHDGDGDVFFHRELCKRHGVAPEPYMPIGYLDCESKKGRMAVYVESVEGNPH